MVTKLDNSVEKNTTLVWKDYQNQAKIISIEPNFSTI